MFIIERSGGLVDYDDDEDDEDYKPPPKKKTDGSDENEGLTEFRMKRNLVLKEEPEPKRLQRSPKGSKPREGVLAALCSTLSEAVLPSKKVSSAEPETPLSNVNQIPVEPSHQDGDYVASSDSSQNAGIENHTGKEEVPSRSASDESDDSVDNTKGEDESPLLQPKSPPEMTVSGS